MIIQTQLLLRPWREKDLKPFAKLNADLRVMEYLESNQMAKRVRRRASNLKY